MLKKVIAGLVGAGLVLGVAPAFAGEWKLNPRACPDLVEDRYDRIEDRRDARRDYGRRDRREDRADRRENRRDRAVTVCPLRAFYYAPDRYDRRARQGRSDRYGRAYGHSNSRRHARLPLRYDRRMRMQYAVIDGRRIYVRG